MRHTLPAHRVAVGSGHGRQLVQDLAVRDGHACLSPVQQTSPFLRRRRHRRETGDVLWLARKQCALGSFDKRRTEAQSTTGRLHSYWNPTRSRCAIFRLRLCSGMSSSESLDAAAAPWPRAARWAGGDAPASALPEAAAGFCCGGGAAPLWWLKYALALPGGLGQLGRRAWLGPGLGVRGDG